MSCVSDFFLVDLVFDFQVFMEIIVSCISRSGHWTQFNEKIWTETSGVLRFENSA